MLTFFFDVLLYLIMPRLFYSELVINYAELYSYWYQRCAEKATLLDKDDLTWFEVTSSLLKNLGQQSLLDNY